jgi:hypothetical protein
MLGPVVSGGVRGIGRHNYGETRKNDQRPTHEHLFAECGT